MHALDWPRIGLGSMGRCNVSIWDAALFKRLFFFKKILLRVSNISPHFLSTPHLSLLLLPSQPVHTSFCSPTLYALKGTEKRITLTKQRYVVLFILFCVSLLPNSVVLLHCQNLCSSKTIHLTRDVPEPHFKSRVKSPHWVVSHSLRCCY